MRTRSSTRSVSVSGILKRGCEEKEGGTRDNFFMSLKTGSIENNDNALFCLYR